MRLPQTSPPTSKHNVYTFPEGTAYYLVFGGHIVRHGGNSIRLVRYESGAIIEWNTPAGDAVLNGWDKLYKDGNVDNVSHWKGWTVFKLEPNSKDAVAVIMPTIAAKTSYSDSRLI